MTILGINIMADPWNASSECLNIMGLWLWFERGAVDDAMFCENRETVPQEVHKLANRICLPALIDLKQRTCNGEFGTSSGQCTVLVQSSLDNNLVQRLSWLTSGKKLSICLENEMGAYSNDVCYIR
ncbi:uncharacterized protein LOC127239734 [Andrographis paniculata]|uniref:uncharacterized protein LOC127239734 n=1 Tax=Andrographis paniculata TaxID=175694 RepID=UPI0021E7A0B9|nr:uncharacterized protein LOC127239734 [Andrographis paniculata]